jgi:predicted naringenin-chalcone synthase
MTETLSPKQLPITAPLTTTKPAANTEPKTPTFLLGIGTAVPQHYATQDQARDFMHQVLSASASDTTTTPPLGLLKRIYAHSGIEKRHSVIGDYTKSDPADFTFYPPNWALEPAPTTAARMAQYEAYAVDLAAEAAQHALDAAGVAPEEVTHMVISTCTGFFAPGADVLLLRRLGMATSTARLVLGFMGCYAGVSGIRTSHQIVQGDPNAVVLQVAIELCSLHYQKDMNADTIVANAIFADGSAAAVYGSASSISDSAAAPPARVVATHSDVSADSLDRMSWRIGDHGFVMTLDAGIPAILREEVPGFVDALAEAGHIDASEIAGWVIHPGGRKIVESIQQTLDLTDDDVQSSYGVLREFGNMSSATILFVLQRELARGLPTGAPIAAMAFGPGLTMEGALLEAQ